MILEYVLKRFLEPRTAVDEGPDIEVKGLLLVSKIYVLKYWANQSSTGCDCVYVYPAIHNGKKKFVLRSIWCPVEGYSASGTQETIISLNAGIKLLVEHDVFQF